MSDPQTSETPLRTTFKIKLNGDTLAIATVGQAYQFLTNFKSVEWMEFRGPFTRVLPESRVQKS